MEKGKEREFDIYSFIATLTLLLGLVIMFMVLVMTPKHRVFSEYINIQALGWMGLGAFVVSVTISLWAIYKNTAKCICLISFLSFIVMAYNAFRGF